MEQGVNVIQQKQKRTSDGLAVASLIIGIIALVGICCMGGLLGVVGAIFGIIAIADKACNRKSSAIIGTVLSLFALLLTIGMLVIGGSDDNKSSKEPTSTQSVGVNEESNATEKYTEKHTESTTEKQTSTEIETEEVTTQVPTEALVDGMRPEFKKTMDSYEKFFDDYCDIMKKFSKNPNDLSILADYAKFTAQYADYMSKMEAMENEEMNDAEAKYYLEVTARISKKLLENAE